MKNQSLYILLLLTVLLCCQSLAAQELSVKSLEYIPNDAAAASYETQMQDINGNFAGVVKVYIALDGVQFEGGGVLKQEKRGMGEYWVWMAQGSNRLKVRAPGFLPLEVSFRAYEEVNIVKSKLTYKLVITVPVAGVVQQDDGKSFLLMTVEPANANVTVDGSPQTLNNGQLSALVLRGSHNYEVSATGYLPQKGTVMVEDNMKPLTIRLESTQSTLQLSCATAGAQLYINNQSYGVFPRTVSLFPGSYRVEARLDGYRSHREDITLETRSNKELRIPELERLTGILRVNYMPLGGDVYVDGQKVGTSPGTFRSVGVGSHKVEIRKDGYVSASQTVTVKENATAELSGSLTAATTTTTGSSQSTTGASGNRTFTVKGVSFNMVYVQGDTFTMGATSEQGSDAEDDEKPTRSVTLSSYYIGETEVTQELWQAVMGKNPSYFKGDLQRPVEEVSWEDCQKFIEKLNRMTGQQFRLPTEAQWEYAARGGSKSRGYKYSGSNDLGSVAWYTDNSGKDTHPVKTKLPNELGIYDMSGNVWELCSDYWKGSYSSGSQTNPTGPSSGSFRVIRGGCWGSNAEGCRSSLRSYGTPSNRDGYLGLRLSL